MLVLARKKNQSIVINDNIEVFIIDISADQVKIGIKAPKTIPVHRKEIFDEIQKENILAARSQVHDFSGIKLLKLKKTGSDNGENR
ncbi:MAG: carbon storage regulator [Spirochaetes bacterium GWF1_41_5]|nr:MAG: carbon storage regulator [Spirochaetes bacterium GWF1_41_5]HBE02386.1 carbon storage regulator [Spirochaetia bacterium]